MIIYNIVFRTILHKHFFSGSHFTTSPIFTGFSKYDRGRREGRCIVGIWGPFWRYLGGFSVGILVISGVGGDLWDQQWRYQFNTRFTSLILSPFLFYSSCSSRPLMVFEVRSGIQFLLLQHLLINVLGRRIQCEVVFIKLPVMLFHSCFRMKIRHI